MSTNPTQAPPASGDRPSYAFPGIGELLKFGALWFQLALALYLTGWSFQLQGQIFHHFSFYLLGGFALHYFTPPRYKHWLFVLLSMGSFPLVFGWLHGGWLLGLGVGLIALTAIPGPALLRWGILGAAITLLAFMRGGAIEHPWSGAIWPILGSLFSIRMIIFLYDQSHKTAPVTWPNRLAYFFMVPNVVFPLFPSVDYQTFVRSQGKPEKKARDVQEGMSWIARGVLQLILYRLIYQHAPIDTTDVIGLGSLLRYLSWPFLLYLNVSGQFHLVIGLVRIFGYNLPETHHLFYLASSFTDFWRRINIYWKDFMLKVFYYPAFFRLRKYGNTQALVLGTVWVFFATWFFHAWLWFWIRGEFLLATHDILFWVVLCALVAVNVVLEEKKTPLQRLQESRGGLKVKARIAVKTTGVFLTICVLWSMWITDSVREWASLFSMAGRIEPGGGGIVALVAAGIVIHFLAGLYFLYNKPPHRPFWQEALRTGGMLALLFAIGYPAVYNRFPQEARDLVHQVKSPVLNDRDKMRRQRDYYEKLNDVGWDNPQLNEVFQQKPADWVSLKKSILSEPVDGLPFLKLVPNTEQRHKGVQVRVNSEGLRDLDYAARPAEGTRRSAWIGASHLYGSGVAQEDDFESLLEKKVNESGTPFEILNFGVEGYTPLDILAVLEDQVPRFHADNVVYVGHIIDGKHGVDRLAWLLEREVPLPHPWLDELVERAGARPGMEESAAIRHLRPFEQELLGWIFGRMSELCAEREQKLVFLFVPLLLEHKLQMSWEEVVATARATGRPVIDLAGVYAGPEPEELWVKPWDDHPSAVGHRMVAERLYDEFRRDANKIWRD